MDIQDLRSQAELGNVVNQTMLGIAYLDGIGVGINYEKAFQWLSIAANQGVPRAMVSLARMYAEGLGIPKNIFKAIQLYSRAAKSGEFIAQIALGRMFAQGIEIPIDHSAALQWYSLAAGQELRIINCDELREAIEYVRNHTNKYSQG